MPSPPCQGFCAPFSILLPGPAPAILVFAALLLLLALAVTLHRELRCAGKLSEVSAA